jgi:Flp pilus assembly protein TadG
MVEYALIAIPFFLLVMGSLDLGRAAFYQHLLTTAAQDAARTGIVAGRTGTDMCAAAVRIASAGVPGVTPTTACTAGTPTTPAPGQAIISVDRPTASTSATYATAQLVYSFQPLTPLISSVIGGSVTLAASSSMYIEPE